jgi:hypothetical protein
MRLLRFDSVLIVLIILLSCFQSQAQEVLQDVTIEKTNSSSFKIQYKLKAASDYDMEATTLKIFRRRDGKVEEIFSKEITGELSKLQGQVYHYQWKPASGIVKAGDELQAKIVLSLRPSVAIQKANSSNKLPHADAGNSVDVQLPVDRWVPLNGSKSYDEDGKIVSVEWKQITGPTNIRIMRKDSLMTYASGRFREGTYAFELLVTDNDGATAISRTIVHVKPAPVEEHTVSINPVPKKDSAVNQVVPVKAVSKIKGGPANAALNVLLPGVGHYFVSGNYNGEKRKPASFILTALYAGSVGGAIYFNGKSSSDYKKYNELANYREYQKDANGVVIGYRGGNEAEASHYFNSAQAAHRNSMICLGVGGGILVGDVVYTFLKGTKNKKEWEKERTSFRPHLFISSDGLMATAGVQFKF